MHDIPAISADNIRHILRAELSFKVRIAYVIGLLGTATFSIALSSLWWTEPGLPLRTHLAFGVLLAINLGWSAFCLWALTRTKVLYARQGVVAGRLAVLWSAVFVAGAIAVGVSTGNLQGGALAALSGSGFLLCAWMVLRRATLKHQQLLRLRDQLAQLAGLDAAGGGVV
jgi:hypothetical protein